MKKIILITAMSLCAFCVSAQTPQTVSIQNNSGSISINSEEFDPKPSGYYEYGFHKVEIFDTVKVVLLITECDDCVSKSISAFAIRQRYMYSGDKMPTYPPTDYSDYWEIASFLDGKKKPFPETTHIWDSQIYKPKKK